MGGGPVKGGALHGHGAGDEKEGFQPRLGLKGLVGEHAVKAEGDAEAADGVHHQEQGEIDPVDPLVPKKEDGADDSEDGKPNQGQKDDFRQGCGCMGVCDGCAQAVSFPYLLKGGKRSRKIS